METPRQELNRLRAEQAAKSSEPAGTPRQELNRLRAEKSVAPKGETINEVPEGFLSQLIPGALSALQQTGQGLGQLTGLVDQESVDQSNRENQPLLDTAGGMTGNVLGHMGMMLTPTAGLKAASLIPKFASRAPQLNYLASALAAPKGIGTSALLGGAYGGIQAVHEGGSRTDNMIISALMSGAAPMVINALRGAYAGGISPFFGRNPERAAGGILREAAGDSSNSVMRQLGDISPEPKIPGSYPTTAEAVTSGGISTLQRGVAAKQSEAFTKRELAQNSARINALESIGGTADDIENAILTRKRATAPLYNTASKSTEKVKLSRADKLISWIIDNNPISDDIQKLFPKIREKITKDSGVYRSSVKDLASVSKYLGEKMDELGPGGEKKYKYILKQLGVIKKSLDQDIGKAEPAYKQAMGMFKELSKGINEKQVLQELASILTSPLTKNTGARVKADAFANALRPKRLDKIAAKATGFKRAKGSKVLGGKNMAVLNVLRDELESAAFAKTGGKGMSAGSNTFQQLTVDNMLNRAGIPSVVKELPIIKQAFDMLSETAYKRSDEATMKALTEALLNPRIAKRAMKSAIDYDSPTLIEGVRRLHNVPAAVGAYGASQ